MGAGGAPSDAAFLCLGGGREASDIFVPGYAAAPGWKTGAFGGSVELAAIEDSLLGAFCCRGEMLFGGEIDFKSVIIRCKF